MAHSTSQGRGISSSGLVLANGPNGEILHHNHETGENGTRCLPIGVVHLASRDDLIVFD